MDCAVDSSGGFSFTQTYISRKTCVRPTAALFSNVCLQGFVCWKVSFFHRVETVRPNFRASGTIVRYITSGIRVRWGSGVCDATQTHWVWPHCFKRLRVFAWMKQQRKAFQKCKHTCLFTLLERKTLLLLYIYCCKSILSSDTLCYCFLVEITLWFAHETACNWCSMCIS